MNAVAIFLDWRCCVGDFCILKRYCALPFLPDLNATVGGNGLDATVFIRSYALKPSQSIDTRNSWEFWPHSRPIPVGCASYREQAPSRTLSFPVRASCSLKDRGVKGYCSHWYPSGFFPWVGTMSQWEGSISRVSISLIVWEFFWKTLWINGQIIVRQIEFDVYVSFLLFWRNDYYK